jgi:hypothetical protein
MSLPLTVYTNLFTLAGRAPVDNKYIEMLGIWYQFLIRHGGLIEGDSIIIQIDRVTYDFIKNTGEVDDFFNYIEVSVYDQPTTPLEGMSARYKLAATLQEAAPNRMYLHLDLDVLVCRPLRQLYDDIMIQNRLLYTTEEKVLGYAKDILSDNYLADRIPLTDSQRTDLSGTGGIGAGTFGWHNTDPSFSTFFTEITKKITESTTSYYTVDQPFFNEAVLLKKFDNEWSVFHIDSNLVGINEVIRPFIPYVLMNYSGDPGNGQLHSEKLIEAYQTVFETSVNSNGSTNSNNTLPAL